MYKNVIFFDIDGTIVKNTFISPKTIKMFEDLQKKEYLLVLNTGRSYISVKSLAEQLKINHILCSSGGCLYINNHIVYQDYIPYHQLKKIVNYFDCCGLIYSLECQDCIYIQKNTKDKHIKRIQYLNQGRLDEEILIKKFNENYKELESLEFIKVNKIHWFEDKIMYQNKAPLNYQQICQKFGRSYQIVPILGNPLSVSGEICQKGTSKEKRVKFLTKYYNIDINETYAIGDDYNDIEMLKYVKHGIAMGQAPDKVKEICEYVTGDFNQEGVVQAMKYYELI